MTYPEIVTVLGTKLPNKAFSNKDKLINWLISQIKLRRVDKPLTENREEDLRQAGATNQLIDAISANSPPLPKPTPLKTPDKPANTSATDAVKPGNIRKNSIGMELVYIPPGEFMMGSDSGDVDEKPVHRVTISQGFWMGKYEVTQSQYENVIGTNPSNFKGCDDCPVEQLSWNDAKEFISQLNAKNDGFVYSLPTEAQWEYAARAGTTGLYAGKPNDMAWYNANSGSKTHPVGTKQPNAFGLFDMHGNVWEWCEDWYGSYSAGTVTDPKGANNGEYRVLRGGSWYLDTYVIRSANRSRYAPSYPGSNYGFRLAARVNTLVRQNGQRGFRLEYFESTRHDPEMPATASENKRSRTVW